MKKIVLILLVIVNIYANDTNSSKVSWNTFIKMANDINSSELYKKGSAYIDEINTQENRDRAIAFYEKSKEKISAFSVESIRSIACSIENNKNSKQRCEYWKNQEKLNIKTPPNKFCTSNNILFKNISIMDIKMQELDALFIGLCQKVTVGDLTSSQAQAILEKNKNRLQH